jgi:hypothetical protein
MIETTKIGILKDIHKMTWIDSLFGPCAMLIDKGCDAPLFV